MELIYILEDDYDIGEIEKFALKNAGFEVSVFYRASDFYHELQRKTPDLAVMDVVLPDANGLNVVKKIRQKKETERLPILLVSSMSEEMDIVKGLDSGADDYLIKPFGVMELVSRVKALIRRHQPQLETSYFMEQEQISINRKKREVLVAGKKCNVTYKEFELLYLLLKNKGNVLSRDFLMEEIWGIDFVGESRTLDMHIRSLRKKLGERGKLIKTIRNVGYRLDS